MLTDCNLVCATGEFVGLIGTNGSGKSTLLRVLSGASSPQAGDVRLDGESLTRIARRELARRLAFLPQQESAAFDFTAREVVLMGRYPHHSRFHGDTETDYDIVARALADADALPLADRPITQLSGGEHRRVLLARALAQQTPLLLLDEPTAHLDIAHQIELMTLIRARTQTGNLGALAALHDLNQAAEFCDRLILLAGGRILAQGSPEEVIQSANLRAAYGADGQVGRNPVTGRPFLLALHLPSATMSGRASSRVHVVCGGGTGVSTLGTLVRYGFKVSAGVLNRLDSDEEAARALGIEVALEAPFSPIGSEARAACAALMAAAETILVAPVPFGHGNLANLELTREAQKAGKRVVMLEDSMGTQDYAGGRATALFTELRQQGAETYPRLEAWPGLSPPMRESVLQNDL